jgi:hypothetical protein
LEEHGAQLGVPTASVNACFNGNRASELLVINDMETLSAQVLKRERESQRETGTETERERGTHERERERERVRAARLQRYGDTERAGTQSLS